VPVIDSADRSLCPNTDNHEQHFWKYSDEAEAVVHRCPGYVTIHVDIFERS
jgi:hypothetical protein